MLTIKLQIDAPHIPEALTGYQVYDHGDVFPGILARVDRQKVDGTWEVWHVAQWRGEEREFTSYGAASGWLLQCKQEAT